MENKKDFIYISLFIAVYTISYLITSFIFLDGPLYTWFWFIVNSVLPFIILSKIFKREGINLDTFVVVLTGLIIWAYQIIKRIPTDHQIYQTWCLIHFTIGLFIWILLWYLTILLFN